MHPLSQALGTSDGWQLLSFLESLAPAEGLTPRTALEQGIQVEHIQSLGNGCGSLTAD